jgi:allophanate hydrolase subunit 2
MSLVVVHALGPISIQDLGRTGHMHEGVPPGGAAVPTRLIAANRAVGNRDDAAAFEVYGVLVLRAEERVDVATSDGACTLAPGEEVRVADPGWTYLAVRGGIAVPRVLDGHGALPGAVPIQKGARFDVGREPAVHTREAAVLAEGPVRVVPGPDLDAFGSDALDVLCADPYSVAVPARTGAILKGARVPRVAGYRERSRPMVRGAIEIPADGSPIVLGPDHPTTGGYPVIAVVATDDIDRVFAFRRVQFTT